MLVRQRGHQLEVLPNPTTPQVDKNARIDCPETSSSDDDEADEVLKGLSAPLGLESDREASDQEDDPVPARLARLPRIMEDVENA